MKSFFLSYSRYDVEIARHLFETSASTQLSLWFDLRDVDTASDWFNRVEKGIAESQGLLLLLSENSLASATVQTELAHAMALNKPVRIVRLDNCEIPPDLIDYEDVLSTDLRSNPLAPKASLQALEDEDSELWKHPIHSRSTEGYVVPQQVRSFLAELSRLHRISSLSAVAIILSPFIVAQMLQKELMLFWLLPAGVLTFGSVIAFKRFVTLVTARRISAKPAQILLAVAFALTMFASLTAGLSLLHPADLLTPEGLEPQLILIAYSIAGAISAAKLALRRDLIEGDRLKYLERWLPTAKPSNVHPMEIESRPNGTPHRTLSSLDLNAETLSQRHSHDALKIVILHHRVDARFAEFLEDSLEEDIDPSRVGEILRIALPPTTGPITSLPEDVDVLVVLSTPFLEKSLAEHPLDSRELSHYLVVPVIFQTVQDSIFDGIQAVDARHDYRKASQAVAHLLDPTDQALDLPELFTEPSAPAHRRKGFFDDHPWPWSVTYSFGPVLLMVVWAGVVAVVNSFYFRGPLQVLCCLAYLMLVIWIFYLGYWHRRVDTRFLCYTAWLSGIAFHAIGPDLLVIGSYWRYGTIGSVISLFVYMALPGLTANYCLSNRFSKFVGMPFELWIWNPSIDRSPVGWLLLLGTILFLIVAA